MLVSIDILLGFSEVMLLLSMAVTGLAQFVTGALNKSGATFVVRLTLKLICFQMCLAWSMRRRFSFLAFKKIIGIQSIT
ncbi:hypothetical protein [Methylomicrobium lacus]|uniref:hypothetical protein n=1 Tax=Methylomicrobium lacus TaxID=136992 RepID=UPI0035A90C30